MASFRRKGHEYHPPPEPTPEEIERAREELRKASETLAEVERRDDEVTERGENLAKIHKVNHIGPQFWDAVGIRRRRA